MLKHLILTCLLAMTFPLSGWAQSRQAYVKAGDECLEKKDPQSALAYYRQALEYGADFDVYKGLCKAEKEQHNYARALEYGLLALGEETGTTEKKTLAYILADLQKRTGDFAGALSRLKGLIPGDTTEAKKLAELISGYDEAEQSSKNPLPLMTGLLEKDINTVWSDFAPAYAGDSLLYFSSMRFSSPGDKHRVSTGKILVKRMDIQDASDITVLPTAINQASYNNANASISPDGKIMVFSRCMYNDQGNLSCHLYESEWINGKWQDAVKLGESVNAKSFSSTQPCITVKPGEGYLLFFSSNQPGGSGGMDIWTSRRTGPHRYEKATVLGAHINSAEDEWSPFYDAVKDSLYFASERPNGLGGLDLYAISLQRSQTPAHPLPPPYNSSYNDLYFTRSYGPSGQVLLVSNRPPAATLNDGACCYDIFSIKPATVVDSSLLTGRDASVPPQTETQDNRSWSFDADAFARLPFAEKIQAVRLIFPVRLYFDNDYPDPRSILSTTKRDYESLATDYLQRKDEYLDLQKNDRRRLDLERFFSDSVNGNLEKLSTFSQQLNTLLENRDARIKIVITGTASPLAESRYNLILSQRRIQSLRNYWMSKNHPLIAEALDSRRLTLQFMPVGEIQAAVNVSDDVKDVLQSVYSREAALERRIEIMDIQLLP